MKGDHIPVDDAALLNLAPLVPPYCSHCHRDRLPKGEVRNVDGAFLCRRCTGMGTTSPPTANSEGNSSATSVAKEIAEACLNAVEVIGGIPSIVRGGDVVVVDWLHSGMFVGV